MGIRKNAITIAYEAVSAIMDLILKEAGSEIRLHEINAHVSQVRGAGIGLRTKATVNSHSVHLYDQREALVVYEDGEARFVVAFSADESTQTEIFETKDIYAMCLKVATWIDAGFSKDFTP